MVSSSGARARRERLWAELGDNADAVLVCDPRHVTYLTGFYASPFEFRSVHAPAFALLDRERVTLFADNLLAPYSDRADVDAVITPVWYEGKRSAPHRRGLLCREILGELVKRGPRLGCDAASAPLALADALRSQRPNTEIFAVEPLLQRLQRNKDAQELSLLQRSMRAGEAGHAAALRDARPGMSELEVYLLVQEAAIRSAGEPVLVYGDFVSGPRTERIGGPPSSRKLEQGDLVLLDFSVVVEGYRGDFANTFVCGQAPQSEQLALFTACLEALTTGEALLRAGTRCAEIDRAVRKSFAARDLEKNFLTHSGHGLGLGHPDPPYLVAESNEVLEAGDVVTIEPGQYVGGVGGMRYERNYLVTEDGYELLSQHALTLTQHSA